MVATTLISPSPCFVASPVRASLAAVARHLRCLEKTNRLLFVLEFALPGSGSSSRRSGWTQQVSKRKVSTRTQRVAAAAWPCSAVVSRLSTTVRFVAVVAAGLMSVGSSTRLMRMPSKRSSSHGRTSRQASRVDLDDSAALLPHHLSSALRTHSHPDSADPEAASQIPSMQLFARQNE